MVIITETGIVYNTYRPTSDLTQKYNCFRLWKTETKASLPPLPSSGYVFQCIKPADSGGNRIHRLNTPNAEVHHWFQPWPSSTFTTYFSKIFIFISLWLCLYYLPLLTYFLTRYSSLFSLTPKYRPVVRWRILIGWYQLMKPPAHLVLASSSRHSDLAWLITLPPS